MNVAPLLKKRSICQRRKKGQGKPIEVHGKAYKSIMEAQQVPDLMEKEG